MGLYYALDNIVSIPIQRLQIFDGTNYKIEQDPYAYYT